METSLVIGKVLSEQSCGILRGIYFDNCAFADELVVQYGLTPTLTARLKLVYLPAENLEAGDLAECFCLTVSRFVGRASVPTE